jgi:hypothetical protein
MKVRSWSAGLERDGIGWPMGSLIFYGPDNRHATKVVAAILEHEGDAPQMMKWFENGVDVRVDQRIGAEVMHFFRRHSPKRIAVMEGIFGCPHGEGIDYPDGGVCPRCPFWATHDRFEHAVPSEKDG